MIQTNGGWEYDNLMTFLKTRGITRQISCLYTGEQNKIFERKHRHIVEIGLSMLGWIILCSYFLDE